MLEGDQDEAFMRCGCHFVWTECGVDGMFLQVYPCSRHPVRTAGELIGFPCRSGEKIQPTAVLDHDQPYR